MPLQMDHPSLSLPGTGGWKPMPGRSTHWIYFSCSGPQKHQTLHCRSSLCSKRHIHIPPQTPTGAHRAQRHKTGNASQHLPKRSQTLLKNSNLTLIRHGGGVHRRTSGRKTESYLGLRTIAQRQWPWESDCPNPLPHSFWLLPILFGCSCYSSPENTFSTDF